MGGGGFYGGKGPTKRSASSSMTTKTPLEIAREEDALEAELGYHVPPADDGGEQKLGWLVNASAVRFRRRLRRRRLSFCALKGNFGIIISLERARERRDWKNSKITSISLRARARDVVSLSFSETLEDDSLTKPRVRSLFLSPFLSDFFSRRSETDDRGVQTIAKATRSGEPVLLLPRRFGV